MLVSTSGVGTAGIEGSKIHHLFRCLLNGQEKSKLDRFSYKTNRSSCTS